jgi:hypothetical protein
MAKKQNVLNNIRDVLLLTLNGIRFINNLKKMIKSK